MSYIYKITNLINKKIYVGKALIHNENYYGSGLQITAAIEKYGKENFSKEILEECSPDELDTREIFWIDYLNARDTKIGYNISIGGTGGNHYWKSLDENGKVELQKKISVAKTGATINYTDEQRKNVKAGLKAWWNIHRDDKIFLKERANPKKYILSDGVSFIRIVNLKDYSKENNLDKTWLCSIATGKKFTPCKGYYCVYDIGQSNEEVIDQIKVIKDKNQKVADNWLEGTRNREKYECKFCKKMVTKSNLTRWHNDKCKNNGNM